MTETQKIRRLIFREVRRLEPRLNTASPTFRVLMIMLGIYVVGPDVERLPLITGQSVGLVERVIRRCRKAGIIRSNTVRIGWEDDELGGISLICDALVGAGAVTRVASPKARAARLSKRTSRLAAGLCGNCGGPRDGSRVTCDKCLAAQKKSAAAPASSAYALKPTRSSWYLHNNYATKRQSTRLGGNEEEAEITAIEKA